jgi:hypothetical protein
MNLDDIKNVEIKTPEQPLNAHIEKKKVGFLFGTGIFFMPYIFSWFTLKKGYSNTVKGVSFVWMAVILINMGNRSPSGVSSSRVVASAKDENKIELIKESCLKVSNIFGASSKLSDLQKDELWKDYKDKTFNWKLSVTEVSSKSFGDGFTVQYKCEGSNSFIQDVVVNYPSSAKQAVLGLEKGSVYSVKGTLTHYSSLLGLSSETL